MKVPHTPCDLNCPKGFIWELHDSVVGQGVQPTTRYRSKDSKKRPGRRTHTTRRRRGICRNGHGPPTSEKAEQLSLQQDFKLTNPPFRFGLKEDFDASTCSSPSMSPFPEPSLNSSSLFHHPGHSVVYPQSEFQFSAAGRF